MNDITADQVVALMPTEAPSIVPAEQPATDAPRVDGVSVDIPEEIFLQTTEEVGEEVIE